MKKSFLITFLFLLFITLTSFTVKEDLGCRLLHDGGTFMYGNSSAKIKVVISGNQYAEYHDNVRYLIVSQIDWLSDCEYNMTITRVTVPNSAYKAGDVINVRVDRVEGFQLYYTSSVNGQSTEGVLIRVK